MKRILGVFAAMVLLLTGCDELNGLISGGIVLVNQDDAQLNFTENGGRVEVPVSAIENWTAESDSKWCIVTPTKGTYKDTKLVVLVDKNKTSEERTGIITLKSTSTTLTITVMQDKLPGSDDDSDSPEQPENKPSESFLFMVTHEMKDFRMPVLSGEFIGLILWGDGRSQVYEPSVVTHSYQAADERVVIMQLEGNPEEFKVDFKSLEGVLKIDFSGL